ncbi:MAG TPA: rRNA maturation RNase YbeY [Kiritimatiellia bacterium]|nr:rRNA maturation RNase YbeY [Kiritimatiellia bacterium]
MKTHILIAQPRRVAAVNTVRLRALAVWLLARAAEERTGFALAELSIALVDDAGIAPLNEQFMRHKGATDVISFRLEPPPGQTLAAGEIVINVQRALAEAKRRRIDASGELAWYLAHGIDHLAGATDKTAAQRAAMHKREKRWLRAAGPLAGNLLRT